jgi:DNA-directed DNA polymerase
MKTINIDIETFSSINISKSGIYKYVESEDFEVLLFSYSIDGGKTEIVDIANGEELSEEIIQALLDDNVIKWAFNAQFERICLSRFLKLTKGTYLNPKSWRCTMIWSAYMGLPFSLEGVGKVLGLEKQKLIEGKDLIKYFCVPCTPTKSNGFRNRNFPYHDRIKWKTFKTYNIRDVDTEKEIQCKLMKFPVPDFIWEEYNLDQEINDRGIKVDLDFVERVIALDDKVRTKLMSELQILTELENPNSVVQLKGWLSEQGVETESLDKKSVKELIKVTKGEVSKALALRMQLSKSSIKKYQAMKDVACEDNRCRGMFQFLGANRTGRFSGRNVQLQNLPRNTMKELFEVRSIIKNRDGDILELLYDNVPDILSQLIRTAFVPKENMKFYVADFSSIEARVIAWLAGETWREELFKKGGDIYCMSASQMFGVPVVKHGINGELRQKGKIAELACGYGGSVGALTAMGALDMGLKEDELKPLVLSWREANQNIVALWWAVDKAIKDAIAMKGVTKTHGIEFECRGRLLRIRLPSGRKLTYIKPKIEINKFGVESVTYEGIGVAKKWERIESYGPKFVENIVQAISRDILMYALQNLSAYNIVAHVHDEIIIEAQENTKLEDICGTMSQAPYWAKGLILTADGYTCDFYMKD